MSELSKDTILYDLIKEQNEVVKAMQHDIHEIKTAIEVIQVAGPRDKIKPAAAGGGAGAALTAILLAIYKYFTETP